jgi:hypothetical protein
MKHKVHPGTSLSLGTASSTIGEVNHKGGQMTRNRRITTVAAGAAGITAVALGVAGAFPSGASVGHTVTSDPSIASQRSVASRSRIASDAAWNSYFHPNWIAMRRYAGHTSASDSRNGRRLRKRHHFIRRRISHRVVEQRCEFLHHRRSEPSQRSQFAVGQLTSESPVGQLTSESPVGQFNPQRSEFAVGQLTSGSAVGQFNPKCSRAAFGQLTSESAWWVLVQYQRKRLIGPDFPPPWSGDISADANFQ